MSANDWKADAVRAAVGIDGGNDFAVDGILRHYTAERDRAFAVIDAAIAEASTSSTGTRTSRIG